MRSLVLLDSFTGESNSLKERDFLIILPILYVDDDIEDVFDALGGVDSIVLPHLDFLVRVFSHQHHWEGIYAATFPCQQH